MAGDYSDERQQQDSSDRGTPQQDPEQNQAGATPSSDESTAQELEAGTGAQDLKEPTGTAAHQAAGEAAGEGASTRAPGAGPLSRFKTQAGARREGAPAQPAAPRPATAKAPEQAVAELEASMETPPKPRSKDAAKMPPGEQRTQPKVQPPSRRDPLSPELEQELQAALGDQPLDEMIGSMEASAAAAGPTAELEPGSRHQASVVRVHGEHVFVTLGGRHEGVLAARQFTTPPNPGEQLEVVVAAHNPEDGLYELSLPGGAVDVSEWIDLQEGSIVECRVTGSNTGGLECKVGNLRGFIPASQIDVYRVENLADYVDQRLKCVVTEANPRRKNLVLSRRALIEREKEEQRKTLLEQLQPGQTREGIVRKIQDFGAFVDLGGIDGLIHVSKLSWDRVNHPSEVLQEGQKVQVKVEKVDPTTGRISLSYRDLLEDPWQNITQKYPEGTVVTGTVSRTANFGAFVKLEPGVEGLIHISELAHHRVQRVNNVVQEGQEVQVKVLSVDPSSQRIGLSLKATQQAPEAATAAGEQDEAAPPRELAVRRRRGPLKGGTDRKSGGESFGLKW